MIYLGINYEWERLPTKSLLQPLDRVWDFVLLSNINATRTAQIPALRITEVLFQRSDLIATENSSRTGNEVDIFKKEKVND